ncbi:pyrophosphate--fructose 6-phosphate 1-phosphotransferase subunit alpha-like isoform X2 [Miscanthus floridulus]
MKAQNPHNVLLGFVGGTEGLFAKKTLEITDDVLSSYKNQGGFDLLGRTVDQIRTTEQINAAKATCCDLNLDSLIIIGGVTSNSDAAQLAEIFAEHNCKTKVIGVPVTLSGDLRNQFVETTVGFDTVCKVNSQLISNVCLDAISAGKYYYFVRLMGGKASHVALECALQSHPNMVILGEEVAFSKLTLKEITNKICDGVEARAEQGKYHGVLVIPEGLIESIPEMYALIQEINNLHSNNVSEADIPSQLSPWAAALFKFLPSFIRRELILHQESDNSAQLSQIDTEQLLAHLVEAEMNKRTKEGKYKGRKFSSVCHFFGSQARGSLPSNFDCNYAYVLGHICVQIIAAGLNGYMATVTNLKDSTNKWRCAAVPLAAMMSVRRHLRGPGAVPIGRPVIHPSPIDLKAESYAVLREKASSFLLDDFYRTPGGIQFEGPGAGTKPITLTIEEQDYLGDIEILQAYLDKVRTILKPGCSREILKASISSIASVNNVLKFMSAPLNTELPLYHFN